jgi:hypothetical protein
MVSVQTCAHVTAGCPLHGSAHPRRGGALGVKKIDLDLIERSRKVSHFSLQATHPESSSERVLTARRYPKLGDQRFESMTIKYALPTKPLGVNFSYFRRFARARCTAARRHGLLPSTARSSTPASAHAPLWLCTWPSWTRPCRHLPLCRRHVAFEASAAACSRFDSYAS